MHTSTRLVATDFHFMQHAPSGNEPVAVAAFCPDYHPQDRVGVVSMSLEQGVLHTSYALLALTTVFYDHMRAQKDEFFDYPQHFAFVGKGEAAQGEAGTVNTETGNAALGNAETVRVGNLQLGAETPQLWNAWSWLDVWPDPKWVTVPATATSMLKRIFDYQINRLFWPRSLTPAHFQAEEPASKIAGYVWKMLNTSLKTVYLYGETDGADVGVDAWAMLDGITIEVRGENEAMQIVQESLVQLPAPLLIDNAVDTAHATHAPQSFTRVDAQAFLAALQGR